MKLKIDDGFYFGIGTFETIAVINGTLVMADRHWKRMINSINKLEFTPPFSSIKYVIERAEYYLKQNCKGNGVLKVIVSPKNLFFTFRKNNYSQEQYLKGFSLNLSSVQRNETSVFTYVKSLNYGDNILEKRKSLKAGFDEPVFLNSKGLLTEGATTNIFFVKEGKIYTPSIECGLLPGTVREYLLEEHDIREVEILPEEIEEYEEMFVTNSLLGIMPVSHFENVKFTSREMSSLLMNNTKNIWMYPKNCISLQTNTE